MDVVVPLDSPLHCAVCRAALAAAVAAAGGTCTSAAIGARTVLVAVPDPTAGPAVAAVVRSALGARHGEAQAATKPAPTPTGDG